MAAPRRPARRRQAELRWSVAADVLKAYRSEPQTSRAELTQLLHLSSGTMTDLLGRLQSVRLIEETAAAPTGRGRPTTQLLPHPDGPLVLAADITATGWRTAIAGVDGRLAELRGGRHDDYSPSSILDTVAATLTDYRRRYQTRISATSVSLAGTLSGTRVVQSSVLGWQQVELRPLGADGPLLCNNDATLAGVAEARRGAARHARVSTHLMVLSGTGGGSCQDGEPILGATGASAEYGHLPFGRAPIRCSCGAVGCWDVELGARALARALTLSLTGPAQEVTAVREWLSTQRPDAPAPELRAQAASLGRGLAGLVNALDPELVTISGLATDLRRLAPDDFAAAFTEALMSYRRSSPPPVLDAELNLDGPLVGAVELALDQVLSPAALSHWAGED